LEDSLWRAHFKKYVKKTLDDNVVSSIGPFVDKFENKLKNYGVIK